MQIEFNKKQYENLLKLVYLGNWMANAHRADDRIEKFEELEHYIFSFAKDFGFPKYADAEMVGDGKFYPTRKFEEETEVHDLHDDYDNETFWHEIADRLSRRDFVRKYSMGEYKNMDTEERFEKMQEFDDKWDDEFEEYGIERLEVKK